MSLLVHFRFTSWILPCLLLDFWVLMQEEPAGTQLLFLGSLPGREAFSKITLMKNPLFRLLFRISALRRLTFQLAVSDQFLASFVASFLASFLASFGHRPGIVLASSQSHSSQLTASHQEHHGQQGGPPATSDNQSHQRQPKPHQPSTTMATIDN